MKIAQPKVIERPWQAYTITQPTIETVFSTAFAIRAGFAAALAGGAEARRRQDPRLGRRHLRRGESRPQARRPDLFTRASVCPVRCAWPRMRGLTRAPVLGDLQV